MNNKEEAESIRALRNKEMEENVLKSKPIEFSKTDENGLHTTDSCPHIPSAIATESCPVKHE